MIRSIFFSPGKTARTDIPPEEFPRLIRDRRGLLWVDFIGEPPETAMPILQSFNFHHLAIDDAPFKKRTRQKSTIGATTFILS